ncbi:tripartite tricarboxylate transporter substrate-binding protein, partial [Pelagibius sp.]|uniref:tripartite tricarboxylate transporter substrate-binding protein n=1 Tax=Pelagibius sp. TaxID=1931238 RepID=UPI0026386827
ALGLDIKIVAGYKGTKEVALAALRGEVDGFAVSDSSARRYLKDDGLTASVILSRERSNLLPDLPTVFEVVSVAEAQAWWIDYIDALMSLGRALVTTPDVPEDRLTLLREAVRDVLTDPKVIEEANAKRRPLNYASADAAKQRIDTVIGSLSEEQLANVRHVAQEKY